LREARNQLECQSQSRPFFNKNFEDRVVKGSPRDRTSVSFHGVCGEEADNVGGDAEVEDNPLGDRQEPLKKRIRGNRRRPERTHDESRVEAFNYVRYATRRLPLKLPKLLKLLLMTLMTMPPKPPKPPKPPTPQPLQLLEETLEASRNLPLPPVRPSTEPPSFPYVLFLQARPPPLRFSIYRCLVERSLNF
jgi:hypothetical protein